MSGFVSVKSSFNGKRISFGNQSALVSGGDLGFPVAQMLLLATFANNTVIARTRSGVGSDDSQFPPLSQKKSAVKVNGKFVRQRPGYADWKSKHGLNPFRDMWGTGKDGGHMLTNSTVRKVDESGATIAFTARKARIKALANEKRTPFYSFSNQDIRKIVSYAEQLYSGVARQVFDNFTGRRKAA